MKVQNWIKKNKTTLGFCFLILGFCIFLMIFLNHQEPDSFWHVKAGEKMFKAGHPLTKDVFSWYLSGKDWMSHEWLFEVLLYSLKLIHSSWYVWIYAFVCVSILFFFLFFANRKGYLKNIPFSLFWITLGCILFGFIQARPHLLSFIFLAFTIYSLYDLFKNENSLKVYFLPLITILWANVHGGSSNLSYLFCFLFLFGGLFSFSFAKIEAKRISKKQVLKYLLVAILCMGAICINPHGIKMLLYPYSNITDHVMQDAIMEWQPTALNNATHYPYLFLLVIIFCVFLFSKKKIEFLDLLLFGVVCFLGLRSVRFWPYTYIVMTFVVFSYIKNRKYDYGSNFVLYFLGFAFIFVYTVFTMIQGISWDKEYVYLNEKMIETVKKEHPKRLYNMYNYGGELIYHDISVFIDGRADLYSSYNLQSYLDISLLSGDYHGLIENYQFDYMLVDNTYPIYQYLQDNSNYELIYHFKNAFFYKKKGSIS